MLLNPQQKVEERTTAEERDRRNKRIDVNIQDMFASEYKKLLSSIRGYKKMVQGGSSFM